MLARGRAATFGYTPEVLLNNMAILKVDPACFDALVLSHGHYDHFGGIVGFLEANKGKLKPKLPIYVGGEDCFCIRRTPAGQFGALDRKAILDADLSLMMASEPAGRGVRCRVTAKHQDCEVLKIDTHASPTLLLLLLLPHCLN
jgi:ribonuclease BN (tRNA processing enzyme)